MLLAGRKLTAVEAKDCGLVTDVFPHDKFTEEVQNRIQTMAKLPPKVTTLSVEKVRCRFFSPQGSTKLSPTYWHC